MPLFDIFTKGQMDAQEMLNANFAAAEAALGNKANIEVQWFDLAVGDEINNFMLSYARLGPFILLRGWATWKEDLPLPVHIATLPEGYRPIYNTCHNVAMRGWHPGTCEIGILSDGIISYTHNSRGTSTFVGPGPDLHLVLF